MAKKEIVMKAKKSGFTLIELLVVISIIALLVSILLPALNEARNVARRVICSSNMKNCGTGMVTYCFENKGMMSYQSWSSLGSWNTTTLFHGDFLRDSVDARNYTFTNDGPINLWCKPWGMGALYQMGIVAEIEMYFCPGATASAQSTGSINLNPDFYTDPTTGGLIAKLERTSIVRVRSSYNYFKNNIKSIDKMNGLSYYYDLIASWDEIAHKSSNGNPKGFNVLYGDSHVECSTDPDACDMDLWGVDSRMPPSDYYDTWYQIMRDPISLKYHLGNNMPDLSQVRTGKMTDWLCNEAPTLGGKYVNNGWRYP